MPDRPVKKHSIPRSPATNYYARSSEKQKRQLARRPLDDLCERHANAMHPCRPRNRFDSNEPELSLLLLIAFLRKPYSSVQSPESRDPRPPCEILPPQKPYVLK